MSQEVATTEEVVNKAPILDPLDNPKVNKAAYDFGRIVESLKKDTQDLSLRSLRRILMNVVEYPFNKNTSALSEKERDILYRIALADACKDVMLEALKMSDEGLRQQLEEAQREINETKTEEVKEGETENV